MTPVECTCRLASAVMVPSDERRFSLCTVVEIKGADDESMLDRFQPEGVKVVEQESPTFELPDGILRVVQSKGVVFSEDPVLVRGLSSWVLFHVFSISEQLGVVFEVFFHPVTQEIAMKGFVSKIPEPICS